MAKISLPTLTAVLVMLSVACSGPTDSQADFGYEVGDVGTDLRHDAVDSSRDLSMSPDFAADLFGVDVGPDIPAATGFGTISGDCGELDDELTSAEPDWFRSTIDFGDDPYDDSDESQLTEGGQEIIADGNAGGSSLLSEVFAYEVLARCESAMLLKTETEIYYMDDMGKITDLLVEIDGERIGVSVTRAVGFPRDDPYSVEQARALLEDKLADIELSSANVADADRWRKQVLSVIAYAPGHADSLQVAYDSIDAATRADTIVWVTVSEGEDEFLY